jgi:hypothetical protein
MRIIPKASDAVMDRQRLAEWRPLGVDLGGRQHASPGCRPIPDRGSWRPCVGLVVTRFLPLHRPYGAGLAPIMTPEA